MEVFARRGKSYSLPLASGFSLLGKEMKLSSTNISLISSMPPAPPQFSVLKNSLKNQGNNVLGLQSAYFGSVS